jgi:hypothetical protein
MIVASLFIMMTLSACGGKEDITEADSSIPESENVYTEETDKIAETGSEAMTYRTEYLDRQMKGSETVENREDEESVMTMKIGESPVQVDWEDNESVEALKSLAKQGDITIQMSMYGGFEQVGSLGESLPRNDKQTTTKSGDIVLYSGNQIVIFYGSNSWAYTRLGHISDKDESQMEELLSNGDETVTISAKN